MIFDLGLLAALAAIAVTLRLAHRQRQNQVLDEFDKHSADFVVEASAVGRGRSFGPAKDFQKKTIALSYRIRRNFSASTANAVEAAVGRDFGDLRFVEGLSSFQSASSSARQLLEKEVRSWRPSPRSMVAIGALAVAIVGGSWLWRGAGGPSPEGCDSANPPISCYYVP